MIVVWPPDGTADQRPAVTTSQIQDHRPSPPKKRFPVEPAGGRQLLERGLCPVRRLEDFPGNRHAEFTFDVATFLHGGSSTPCPLSSIEAVSRIGSIP